MATEKTTKQSETRSPEYWEEKVPVFIEESADGEGGDLPVNISVNGECITIARGVEVMIARKFAEVVNNAKQAARENRAFIKKSAKRPAEAQAYKMAGVFTSAIFFYN